MTTRYRQRPAEITAIQWTDTNAEQLIAFAGERFIALDPEDRTEDPDATASLRESDHASWVLLHPGQWVVKTDDDFSALSDEEFRARYEATDEQRAVEAPCCSDPTCTCVQVNAAGRCDCTKWESSPQEEQPAEAYPAEITFRIETHDVGAWLPIGYPRPTLNEARQVRDGRRSKTPEAWFRIVEWTASARVIETDEVPADAEAVTA